jgi:hypothetical protein
MSNVLDLPAAVPLADTTAHPHRRLLILSRGLSYLFTAILGLVGFETLAGIVVAVFFGGYLMMGAQGMEFDFARGGGLPKLAPGQVRLSDLPIVAQVVFAVGWPILIAPLLMVFDNLRRLFALYGRGIVFSSANARHITRIGVGLIAYPFAQYFGDAVFWLAGGADRASWFHFEHVQAFVLGLIVVAIAQVMAFGHEIEQEKDSFI